MVDRKCLEVSDSDSTMEMHLPSKPVNRTTGKLHPGERSLEDTWWILIRSSLTDSHSLSDEPND
jgi:hypothetical protein